MSDNFQPTDFTDLDDEKNPMPSPLSSLGYLLLLVYLVVVGAVTTIQWMYWVWFE